METTRPSTGVSHFLHPQNHRPGFIRPPQCIIRHSTRGSTTDCRNLRPFPLSTFQFPRLPPPSVSQTLPSKMMPQLLTRCGQDGRITPPIRTLCPLPQRQIPSSSDPPTRTTRLAWVHIGRGLPPNPPHDYSLTSHQRNPTRVDVSKPPLLPRNQH